jgi:hypothetical protein
MLLPASGSKESVVSFCLSDKCENMMARNVTSHNHMNRTENSKASVNRKCEVEKVRNQDTKEQLFRAIKMRM